MTTRLSTLLQTFGLQAIGPQDDPVLTAITPDSRAVKPGTLFVALPGTKVDGRTFIPAAVQNGAAAVLAPTGTVWPADVPACPLVLTGTPRHVLAVLATALAGRSRSASWPLPAQTAKPARQISCARSGRYRG